MAHYGCALCRMNFVVSFGTEIEFQTNLLGILNELVCSYCLVSQLCLLFSV